MAFFLAWLANLSLFILPAPEDAGGAAAIAASDGAEVKGVAGVAASYTCTRPLYLVVLPALDDGCVAAATASGADAGDMAGDAAVAAAEPAVNPELEAFQRQFAAVQENTGDFNGWCSVISAAEKLVRSHWPSFTCLTSAKQTWYFSQDTLKLHKTVWSLLSLRRKR